jgi:hypothetical protein
MNWRESPSIDELVMAGVWNLHLVAQGVEEIDPELFRAIAKDFPSGEDYDHFVKWSTYNFQLHHVARLEAELVAMDIVTAAYEVFWSDYLEALKTVKENEGRFCFEFLRKLSDVEFIGAAFFAMAAIEGHQHNPEGLEDFSLIKHFYEGSMYRPALSKLKTQFSQFDLRLPSLPYELLRGLSKHRKWSWSNRFEREELADYFLKLERGPSTEVNNLLSISWAGHGLNSYALSLNVKFGPIHVLLKRYMGGVYGNPSADVEKWNKLVDSFEPLFSEISRPHYPHNSGEAKIWIQNEQVFEFVNGNYTEKNFESIDSLIEYVLQTVKH